MSVLAGFYNPVPTTVLTIGWTLRVWDGGCHKPTNVIAVGFPHMFNSLTAAGRWVLDDGDLAKYKCPKEPEAVSVMCDSSVWIKTPEGDESDFDYWYEKVFKFGDERRVTLEMTNKHIQGWGSWA